MIRGGWIPDGSRGRLGKRVGRQLDGLAHVTLSRSHITIEADFKPYKRFVPNEKRHHLSPKAWLGLAWLLRV